MKTREVYDTDQIKARLSFLDLFQREVGPMRRAGVNWVGLCPFHSEKTPSFTVFGEGDGHSLRGKCFGCGWAGDVLDLWCGLRGVEFRDGVGQLAGLVGLSPRLEGVEWSDRPRDVDRAPRVPREMVRAEMPVLARPSAAVLSQLAEMRGLQVEGLRAAVDAGRLRVSDWPLFFRGNEWVKGGEVFLSWVVTDGERWCAQYRRLDGESYEVRRKGQEVRFSKSWSTKNPAWPLGAADVVNFDRVLLVEGGADMLAAYHFLWGLGLLGSVGVVCILGASNRICDRALAHFKGKRVRIVMDADLAKLNERTGRKIAPGMEAALRWQEQLTEAGAAVSVFSLYGLETGAGEVVKDLNDLALCSAEVVGSREIQGLFFDWDF